MPVTKTTILSTFKTKYLAATHKEYEFFQDGNEGNINKREVTKANEWSDMLENIVGLLIESILEKIESDGLEMGESTAKKMEVQ